MRPARIVRTVLLPSLLAGLIAGGYAGAKAGYVLALVHAGGEQTVLAEGHAETDARMQVACARGVAWAESWQELAVAATDARLGVTGTLSEGE